MPKEAEGGSFWDNFEELSKKSIVSRGDISRIQRAMKKAQAGGTVTVGAIGGSITAGAGASEEKKRYADLVADWWRRRFPNANIVYKNAGIGATGSYLAAHRAGEQLNRFNPDFVVVEFAVNDPPDERAVPPYEALVRSILYSQNRPGVMLMFMTKNTGENAQAQHGAVGEHYNLPMASFRDAIWPKIEKGSILWEDLYADIIHPNDTGHAVVARFITDRLDEIFEGLNSVDMPPLDTEEKPPLYEPLHYKNAAVLDRGDITPIADEGWSEHTAAYRPEWSGVFGKGWETVESNKPLKFEFYGRSVGIIYKCSSDKNMGRVAARVDGGEPIVAEGFFEGGISYTYLACRELARGLDMGRHTVEFTLLDEHHPDTEGGYFALLGLLVAE